MARFSGYIGYGATVETAPGVWEEKIVRKKYYGDVTRNTRRAESGEGLNTDLNISNQISIVADPYARSNFQLMRYVELRGTKWCVTSVDEQYPRLILSLGGVYSENEN